MSENTYSTGLGILFWVLWVVGFLVLLLFGFFAFITFSPDNYFLATWNALVALVEGFILFITALHFLRKDWSLSKLLLWIAIAALGTPLLAFSGCMLLDNMRLGLNIGR